jgi:hypothetical protein
MSFRIFFAFVSVQLTSAFVTTLALSYPFRNSGSECDSRFKITGHFVGDHLNFQALSFQFFFMGFIINFSSTFIQQASIDSDDILKSTFDFVALYFALRFSNWRHMALPDLEDHLASHGVDPALSSHMVQNGWTSQNFAMIVD